MCLAIPMRIQSIHTGSQAVCELDGFLMNVGIELVPDAAPGQYVLVHAGFALELMEPQAAETLRNDITALLG